ncbi:hypothetical protein LINPERHAP2_LOCUS9886 [Linum perenne]
MVLFSQRSVLHFLWICTGSQFEAQKEGTPGHSSTDGPYPLAVSLGPPYPTKTSILPLEDLSSDSSYSRRSKFQRSNLATSVFLLSSTNRNSRTSFIRLHCGSTVIQGG